MRRLLFTIAIVNYDSYNVRLGRASEELESEVKLLPGLLRQPGTRCLMVCLVTNAPFLSALRSVVSNEAPR